jgi:hypothetical protein
VKTSDDKSIESFAVSPIEGGTAVLKSAVSGTSPKPHTKLPQFSEDEVDRARDVFRLLIKVRNRCREQGLIDW